MDHATGIAGAEMVGRVTVAGAAAYCLSPIEEMSENYARTRI